jgi:hypothetical protein
MNVVNDPQYIFKRVTGQHVNTSEGNWYNTLDRKNGRAEPFLRALEMRWPFDDQDAPRRAFERFVQSVMSLTMAQRKFRRQVWGISGELPLGDS